MICCGENSEIKEPRLDQSITMKLLFHPRRLIALGKRGHLGNDEKTIEIRITELKSGGQVYELHTNIVSNGKRELRGNVFCYTVNRLIP